ncbi:MAG: hypothetical protein QOF90_3379 [Acetobacteraceae bacterium]|nr:hypothetical protein [Acetobacteraceae bacterium]MEA2777973.1 hypothetical protein [Acetobacteraceae bacterium]MEA2792365.1 hypothetical protein [Acetobacteraceae bacterium]
MAVETGLVRRPTHDFGWSTSGSNDPAVASPRYAGSNAEKCSTGAIPIHAAKPTTTCDLAIIAERCLPWFGGSIGGQQVPKVGQMLTPPVEFVRALEFAGPAGFASKNEGRDAKHAPGFGSPADRGDFPA